VGEWKRCDEKKVPISDGNERRLGKKNRIYHHKREKIYGKKSMRRVETLNINTKGGTEQEVVTGKRRVT